MLSNDPQVRKPAVNIVQSMAEVCCRCGFSVRTVTDCSLVCWVRKGHENLVHSISYIKFKVLLQKALVRRL